LKLCFN